MTQKKVTYRKPQQRYNAESDMNKTARTVVGGVVVLGALGLMGGMLRRSR